MSVVAVIVDCCVALLAVEAIAPYIEPGPGWQSHLHTPLTLNIMLFLCELEAARVVSHQVLLVLMRITASPRFPERAGKSYPASNPQHQQLSDNHSNLGIHICVAVSLSSSWQGAATREQGSRSRLQGMLAL